MLFNDVLDAYILKRLIVGKIWLNHTCIMHELWQTILIYVAQLCNFCALHYERLKKSFSTIYNMPMLRKCQFYANLP